MHFDEYVNLSDEEVELLGDCIFLRSGEVLSSAELRKMDAERIPEEEIAKYHGISRMGLWKARKRLGILRERRRADAGKPRIPDEMKKAKHREYMRVYRQKNPQKFKRNQYQLGQIFEKVVGRPRRKGEVIHHIDGNPQNNDHRNLVICNHTYHMQVFHK